MLIAWMMCASTALLLSKYYKRMWPNDNLCGVEVWFAVSPSVCPSVRLSICLSVCMSGYVIVIMSTSLCSFTCENNF